MVARRAHNPKVVGSNPAPATNPLFLKRCDATLAQLVERNLAKVEVTSSSLVCRSKFKSSQCTLAQLVVRNVAKVEVTPSSLKIESLVCRSKLLFMVF